MDERSCQHIRLSRPFRAEKSKSARDPWDAACGFPHGHISVLPTGAAR
ncbi:MAG: hypothetical protein AB7H80_17165 [Candidatus Kapaibacterium sp.]